MTRRLLTRWDVWLFALVLVAAGAFFGGRALLGGKAAVAVVTVAGEEVRRIPLNASQGMQEIPIESNGLHLTVEVDGARVRIREADCPDRLCVRTGWLSRPLQSAVCLPARVTVSVEGDSEMDAVIG